MHFYGVRCVTAILLCVAALFAAAESFTIEEFGAVGDGVSDDSSALGRALESLRETDGRRRLQFSAGKSYRLGSQNRSDAQFDFSGMENVEVDGQGATLVIHPVHGVARFFDSKNITFKNFTVQHDPLPFMQGIVQSVDSENGSFVWHVQEGFPLPPTEEWMRENGHFFDNPAADLPGQSEWDSRSGPHSPWCWGVVLDAEQRMLKRDFPDHLRVGLVVPSKTGNERAFQVFVADAYKEHIRKMAVGERFILPRFWRTKEEYFSLRDKGWMFEQNVQVRNSSDITIENMTFYSARPGMVFGVRNNDGPVFIRGCAITWLPGSDRLIAAWRDGIHCKNNRIGPVIENCRFEGLFDDSINLSADAVMARAILAPDRLELTTAVFDVGDAVGIFYPQAGVWKTGISVKQVDGTQVFLSELVEDVVCGTMTSRKDAGATQFYNLSRANDGFVVRDSFFGMQRRHAVLARCRGVIENNEIRNVCGSALEAGNENGSFYEGPFPRGLCIRNNRISGTVRTPIILRTSCSASPVSGDLVIENNEIRSGFTPVVQLRCVENVTFINNVFLNEDGEQWPDSNAVAVDPSSCKIEFK